MILLLPDAAEGRVADPADGGRFPPACSLTALTTVSPTNARPLLPAGSSLGRYSCVWSLEDAVYRPPHLNRPQRLIERRL